MLHFLENMHKEKVSISTGKFDILRGAYYNDFEEVNHALEIDQRCIRNVDHLGRTAIHIAAQRGFVEMTEHLLNQTGADPRMRDVMGRDVLEIAKEAANPKLSDMIFQKMFPGLAEEFTPK